MRFSGLPDGVLLVGTLLIVVAEAGLVFGVGKRPRENIRVHPAPEAARRPELVVDATDHIGASLAEDRVEKWIAVKVRARKVAVDQILGADDSSLGTRSQTAIGRALIRRG
jgi:hypothetical protein